MVTCIEPRIKQLGSEPWPGTLHVFLGKTLYSHSASLCFLLPRPVMANLLLILACMLTTTKPPAMQATPRDINGAKMGAGIGRLARILKDTWGGGSNTCRHCLFAAE